MGAKIKTKKQIPRASKKSLDQKLTPPKSPSFKNLQEGLYFIRRTIRGRNTRALQRIFRLFWIPSLPPQKNPYLNQATHTQKQKRQIFLPKKILRSSLSPEIRIAGSRLKCADLEYDFCSRFLRLSVVPWCTESQQIAMCCLEWLGRLKWRATGLDASLSSFSTSRRCTRNRSPSRLPVSPMCNFLYKVQVMRQMTLAEIHVKRSVILTDRLGPDYSIWWTENNNKYLLILWDVKEPLGM